MRVCDICGALFLTAGLDIPPLSCRACEQYITGDWMIRLRDLTEDERTALRVWLDQEPNA